MIVRELSALSGADVRRWHGLFLCRGRYVHHGPDYAAALATGRRPVLVAERAGALTVLTIHKNVATVAIPGVPLLGEEPPGAAEVAHFFELFRRTTGLDVYVPLLDSSDKSMPGARVWPRSPNSLIDWSQDGADLLARVGGRGGSQVVRKRCRIERAGLVLDCASRGPAAVHDMLTVDDRSWKAEAGQSLRQRGSQADLYGYLVSGGHATVTFLRDGDRPIAFRVDAYLGGRLTCLKWSYDQMYARYSPGLHLLTVGMLAQWTGCGVDTIDLFGGPDHLKDLLHTERVERMDLWFGDQAAGAALEAERRGLDTRVQQALHESKGLRHVYA